MTQLHNQYGQNKIVKQSNCQNSFMKSFNSTSSLKLMLGINRHLCQLRIDVAFSLRPWSRYPLFEIQYKYEVM